MPTYEYYCKKCGVEFEKFQRMSEEPLKICPKCGQAAVHRKISGGTGLIFKGSGFYVNDYGGKKETKSTPKTRGKEISSPSKNSTDKPASENPNSSSKNPVSK